MTRVPVNGLHFNVETAGAGRPLLLLHGFTASSASWAPFLEALSSHHRVLAIDLLGHGASDSPVSSERYRVERQIDDLTALLNGLHVEEYDLLGYSMGGRLATHLALAHHDRVGRLILESASPGILDSRERADRVAADERLAAMLGEGITGFVDHWERLPLFATQRRLPLQVREQVRAERLASNPQGLAGSLRGFGAGAPEPLHNRLGELPLTLLISGELDEKYRRLAHLMADQIPDAEVAIIPGAGHTVHLEQPDLFLEAVTRFLHEDAPDQTHDIGNSRQSQSSGNIDVGTVAPSLSSLAETSERHRCSGRADVLCRESVAPIIHVAGRDRGREDKDGAVVPTPRETHNTEREGT